MIIGQPVLTGCPGPIYSPPFGLAGSAIVFPGVPRTGWTKFAQFHDGEAVLKEIIAEVRYFKFGIYQSVSVWAA